MPWCRELEARVLDGDRALIGAPPDVSRQLRLTAQAEADAWQHSADAQLKHDPAGSASATALARHMVAQREQLETANARYQTWATDTSNRRETAGKARVELQRRGLAQQTAGQQAEPEREPQTMVEWWRQLEAGLAAMDRAIKREHQAAVAAGNTWPPERHPQPGAEPMPEPDSSPGAGQAADGRFGLDDQAARLDRLFSQARGAAHRLTAKTRPARPEPGMPLASNDKPMQNPSTSYKLKPLTSRRSSCKCCPEEVAGDIHDTPASPPPSCARLCLAHLILYRSASVDPLLARLAIFKLLRDRPIPSRGRFVKSYAQRLLRRCQVASVSPCW